MHIAGILELIRRLYPALKYLDSGHDKAAEIAKKARKEGTTVRESTLTLGYLKEEEFDNYVNPRDMV
jgi:fumarate hydratase class II